jgi:hypothetical protein
MARGDTYVAPPVSIATGAVYDLQPASGEEIVIHNIMHEANIELQYYDGTDTLTFLSETGVGILEGLQIHCTNATRLRIKNTDAASKLIAASGMYTK